MTRATGVRIAVALIGVGVVAASMNAALAGRTIKRAGAVPTNIVEMNGKMKKAQKTFGSSIPLTVRECTWLGGTVTLDVSKCPASKMRCQGSNGRSICIEAPEAATK